MSLTPWQIREGLVGELVDLVDHFRQVVVKLVNLERLPWSHDDGNDDAIDSYENIKDNEY